MDLKVFRLDLDRLWPMRMGAKADASVWPGAYIHDPDNADIK